MTGAGYGPLGDLRVVDLTHILAGPVCALMLADMGAEVIKIERVPFEADEARTDTEPYNINGVSAPHMMVNRNKKSLPLDLKHDEGREILARLIAGADIILENYRPGVMDRLGMGWDVLHERHPRLIYGAVSGFGRTGPYAERAGFDLITQGMAGLMSITGEGHGRPPVKPGPPMTDTTAGILLAMGVLAALHHRERTGEGQMVDTSLFEAGIVHTYWHSAIAFSSDEVPGPLGSGHPLSAPYQAFPTKDGWLTLGAANGPTWQRFVDMMESDALRDAELFGTNEKRMANLTKLVEVLDAIFKTRTTDDWLAALDEGGVPAGPLNTVPQMHRDDQALARDMIVTLDHPVAGAVKTLGLPVKFSATPGGPRQPAALYGQHTRALLREHGYDDPAIDRLAAGGVVGLTDA
jgi:crotonobetainyl-CoA:carnitine CoA-transferase CaiB-like acyl-CoA transferase